MTDAELREILLVEAHRIIEQSAAGSIQRIGQPIPDEARPGYFTAEDAEQLQPVFSQLDLDHPLMQKWMTASAARTRVLSYPPESVLSDEPSAEELDALSSMSLSAAERSILRRIVAEACANTLFHFFCLLDSVGDPEVMPRAEQWLGADFCAPREEGPFLHDDFGDAYWTYQRLRRKSE